MSFVLEVLVPTGRPIESFFLDREADDDSAEVLGIVEKYRERFDLDKLIVKPDFDSRSNLEVERHLLNLKERMKDDILARFNITEVHVEEILYLAWQMGLIGKERRNFAHIHELCSGEGALSWIVSRARALEGSSTGVSLHDKDKKALRGAKWAFESGGRHVSAFHAVRKNIRSASLETGNGVKFWMSRHPGDLDAVFDRIKALRADDITRTGTMPEMVGILPCFCHCYPDRMPKGLQGHVEPEDWSKMSAAVRGMRPETTSVANSLDALRVLDLNNHSENGMSGSVVDIGAGRSVILASF